MLDQQIIYGAFIISEYGGLGLDYTYSVALAEELGNINCGGVPMAIGVQTDMSTPALAKYSLFIVCSKLILKWSSFVLPSVMHLSLVRKVLIAVKEGIYSPCVNQFYLFISKV